MGEVFAPFSPHEVLDKLSAFIYLPSRNLQVVRLFHELPYGHPRILSKNYKLSKGVPPEPVGPVDRDAGALSHSVEPLQGSFGGSVICYMYSSHAVVGGGPYGNEVLHGIHTFEVYGELSDLREPLLYPLLAQMPKVEVNVSSRPLSNTPSFPYLILYGPRDHVPRGELHLLRSVSLHEPLAQLVHQVSTLSPAGLREEYPRFRQARGVELDELNIL